MDKNQFKKSLVVFEKNGVAMDELGHNLAMFCLEQINLHHNPTSANQLLSACGKSLRKEALKVWFKDFGTCKEAKDGTLIDAQKKQLKWEGEVITADDAMLLADSLPFYTYTKEIKPASSYDVMEAIKNIIKRAAKFNKDGKEVKHGELVAAIQAALPVETVTA